MTDETKVWMALISLAAIFIISGAALIYANERDMAALRQAACANPETVACALVVRR